LPWLEYFIFNARDYDATDDMDTMIVFVGSNVNEVFLLYGTDVVNRETVKYSRRVALKLTIRNTVAIAC